MLQLKAIVNSSLQFNIIWASAFSTLFNLFLLFKNYIFSILNSDRWMEFERTILALWYLLLTYAWSHLARIVPLKVYYRYHSLLEAETLRIITVSSQIFFLWYSISLSLPRNSDTFFCHFTILSRLTNPISYFLLLWQYFKMNPENYDGYGGVEHVEYCFQVHTSLSISSLLFHLYPFNPFMLLGVDVILRSHQMLIVYQLDTPNH